MLLVVLVGRRWGGRILFQCGRWGPRIRGRYGRCEERSGCGVVAVAVALGLVGLENSWKTVVGLMVEALAMIQKSDLTGAREVVWTVS